jgi:hypothetical protein
MNNETKQSDNLYWYVVSDDESWYRAGPHGPYTSKEQAEEMKLFYQRKNRGCAYRIESKPRPKE